MLYLFYILLGFLPSLIWLTFYLRKDKHPEPNSMVLKIFIWGMLLAPLAVVLEMLLIWFLDPSLDPMTILSKGAKDSFLKIILAATLIPALVEEYLKYSIVKSKALKSPEFDEPVDAMLYCIIAALGFAAVENLLILSGSPLMSLGQALSTISLRFLGATFVHALASGLVGYYLALGLLNSPQRKKLIFIGLTIAIIFHACYNYLVIMATETNKLAVLFIIILLALMAVIISNNFRKLKKLVSICKI
jgi:RsiW-degrading membrane proteinase PrsW (M82 family)